MLSRSEHDPAAAAEWKAVEARFERTGRILHLHFPGGEVIRTTPEHPFYVAGKGWVQAGGLRAGDRLATLSGEWVAVEEVFDTQQWEAVYNLRVADHHTYFVGDDGWGCSLWAHNLSCADFDNAKPVLAATEKTRLATQGEVVLRNLPTKYSSLNIRSIVETQLLRDSGRYYDSAPGLVDYLKTIQAELGNRGQRGHYNTLVEAGIRIAAGHRVALEQSATTPTDKADIIDYTSSEAIQMKTVTSGDAGKVHSNLLGAVKQLFGLGQQPENPPAGYTLIAWVKMTTPGNPYAGFTTAQQFSAALKNDYQFTQASPVFNGIDQGKRDRLVMRFETPGGTQIDLRYSDLQPS